jgi:putative ABC transport system permease protein
MLNTLGDLGRDLRYGWRSLRRTPVLAAAAVASIGLGIGATTAVFSVVDAALFRQPPLHQPEQLAVLYVVRQTPNAAPERQRWSWARFRLLQQWSRSFDYVGSFSLSVLALTDGEPEPVNVEMISDGYLDALHVQPIAGRSFSAHDDFSPGPNAVALMAYDLWQRRFGGDRSVVGRPIVVNGTRLTIVGILPRGFSGLTARAQLWMPATMAPRVSYPDYLTTNQNFISVVGRLRPGVTIDVAREELAVLGVAIQRAAPTPPETADEHFSATALSLNDARIDATTRRPMFVLLGAAAGLLCLACANVAGLLLGRGVSRRREIAIRVATGASRARLLRQLLAESALLACGGAGLGVAIALLLTARIGLPSALWGGRNMYGALGEFADARVDLRVVAFAVATCGLTALLFGIVPAVWATRVDLTAELKHAPGGNARAAAGSRIDLRQIVVAIESALAVLLLVASALLAAGWHRLATIDAGFDRSQLVTFLIRPPEVRYPAARAPALIDRVLDEIRQVPEVDAASVDGCTPLSTGCANTTLFIAGRATSPSDAPPVLRHYIGADHFRVLRVPVLRGRIFNTSDRAGSNRVAIINQTAARRFWPNEDPIGQRVWFGGGSPVDRPDSSVEIVGIVGDVAYQPLAEHPIQSDFYTPYAQFTYATRTVLVRTRGDPAAVVPALRRAVRRADPGLALFEVQMMEERAGDSWARLSYQTKILGGFAVVALLLAGMGIFAVVAHVVGDRRREIGIRVALGASSARVLTAVGGRGALPALLGVAAGAATSIVVGRALAALVFGVRPFEPAAMGLVLLVVTTVALLAAYLAARRALAIDPSEALRFD